MSAFVVGKPHIDALVSVAWLGPRLVGAGNWQNISCGYFYNGKWTKVDDLNHDAIGKMLWTENHKSYCYRYKDQMDLWEVELYTLPYGKQRPLAVEALKAITCYEYQSCEHPEWEASEAAAFCKYLRNELITALPGYDEAPWEYRG